MLLSLTLEEFTGNPLYKLGCELHFNGDFVKLTYEIGGDVSGLLVAPARKSPQFVDTLWQSTCFECFVLDPSSGYYLEFNQSSSGDWAAFLFRGYRQKVEDITDPGFRPRDPVLLRTARGLRFEYSLALSPRLFELIKVGDGGNIFFQPTVVLQTTDGQLGFYAKNHGKEKADFHRSDLFALQVYRQEGAWSEAISNSSQ